MLTLLRLQAALIASKRILQLRYYVIGDMDVFQDLPQALSQDFLSRVRQFAFSTVAGAMVIRVLVLLHSRRHHAIVIGARQQSGKGKLMLAAFGFVVSSK